MIKKTLPVLSIFFIICFVSSCFSSSNTNNPVEKYTVIFDSNGGSSIDSIIVEDGKKVSKPNNPTYEGYIFVCWNYNDVEFDFNTPITSNITLVASWEEEVVEPTTYTVTFNSDGGSAVTSQTVEEGNVATAPADPTKQGFVFKGWLLNGQAYDFAAPVNGNITLVASWEEEVVVPTTYVVTFNSDGGSAVTSQTVEEGNVVAKPEDPTKEGYKFVCWKYNDTEFDFSTVISDDIELVAVWVEDSNINVGEEPDDEEGQYGDIIWG